MNKNLLFTFTEFTDSACSYRLKFFVVRDHLWDGNSLPQLQSSWLVGSRRSKYTEGVAQRIATQRLSQQCEEVPCYSLQN